MLEDEGRHIDDPWAGQSKATKTRTEHAAWAGAQKGSLRGGQLCERPSRAQMSTCTALAIAETVKMLGSTV